MNSLKKYIQSHILVVLISIVLCIIPFFWLKPGEMDLGGDSSRLYYYDPQSYLSTTSLYFILPTSIGFVDSAVFSLLPHMIVLIALKWVFHEPYFLITFFNIAKLVGGFLAMYAITKELLNQKSDKLSLQLSNLASILAGLFYIFSRYMMSNYDMALLYHNQVFLNPLMFYLFLKVLLTKKKIYGWFALLISFIFAPSFSYLASPAFFSFYPLAILFLLLYVRIIRGVRLPWRGMLVGFLIFLGLHAFHIGPVLYDILQKGSHVNTRLFDKESISYQASIFYGILSLASIHRNIFLPLLYEKLQLLSVIFPSIIILGFLFNTKRDRTILLTGIFFLVSLFLLTAKITQIGIDFYNKLFYIPGFSMFRNFTGIWAYIYSFFYALLFGFGLYYIFKRLPLIHVRYLFVIVLVVLVISGWPLINGTRVNSIQYQSKNVKTAIVMDPLYEKTLNYIKSLPDDSKILTLPFTDCCFQVLAGTNNGAYVGPSTIGYLAGKSDFTGYANVAPYSELFFSLAKAKDYESFKQMLGLLNVRYIFHNSDNRILDNFPIYPFSPDYVRKYFPNEQNGYTEFVKNISSEKIFSKNYYGLYVLNDKYYLPHFYSPKRISLYDNNPDFDQAFARTLSFFPPAIINKNTSDPRVIFIDRVWCSNKNIQLVCNQSSNVLDNTPNIFFEKVNRTKYRLRISEVKGPYVLVFSEIYNNNWKLIDATRSKENMFSGFLGNLAKMLVSIFVKDADKSNKKNALYFNGHISEGEHSNIFLEPKTFETWGKSEIAQDTHFEVNGYANAWYIEPNDVGERQNYELILELVNQRVIYMVLPISLTVFVICLFWGILLSNKGSRPA